MSEEAKGFYVYFVDGTHCKIVATGWETNFQEVTFSKNNGDDLVQRHVATLNWDQVKCISLAPLPFSRG